MHSDMTSICKPYWCLTFWECSFS